MANLNKLKLDFISDDLKDLEKLSQIIKSLETKLNEVVEDRNFTEANKPGVMKGL